MGVAPCVMDGGGTSVGVARGAVNDGWGASCGHGVATVDFSGMGAQQCQ